MPVLVTKLGVFVTEQWSTWDIDAPSPVYVWSYLDTLQAVAVGWWGTSCIWDGVAVASFFYPIAQSHAAQGDPAAPQGSLIVAL